MPATAIELKAKCVSISLDSYNQLVRPAKDSDVTYLITYSNLCSTEASNVEIALATRAGLDWRIITTGGKLGQVPAFQRGQVLIRLSYFSFSETNDFINLYVKEDEPLANRKYVTVTSVSFARDAVATITPSPTPSANSPTLDAEPSDITSSDTSSLSQGKSKTSKPVSKQTLSPKVNAPCQKEGLISSSGKNTLICQKNDEGKFVWTIAMENKTPEAQLVTPSSETTNSPEVDKKPAEDSGLDKFDVLIVIYFATVLLSISAFLILRKKRK